LLLRNLLTPTLWELYIAHITYDMFTHQSESPHGLQFQLLVHTEGLLKVTGSRVHCYNISE